MKSIALLLSVTAIGSATSCVYFNSYYNAEKYFRQAEQARAKAEAVGNDGAVGGRNRTQYLTLYDQAVRKASIVLEKYPESDLVEDAMFVAGRALYWQRDYQYAMRSFRDLELNFPDSQYFDRARLWRGRTLLALGQTEEAGALLGDLVRERSAVGDRAGMHLGELATAAGDRRGAIVEYRRTLEAFPESPLKSQLWVRIGEVHVDIGGPARLDSAMAAFDRALKSSPADSVRYRAGLNRGRVQYLQGEADAALETYRALLSQGKFRAWEGDTRILIGRYYRERELLPEALAEFEHVRDDFPQTAVAAMALYETGLLYLQKQGQRERAQEYFAEVSLEKRGSRADSLANVIQGTCAELDGLIEQIWIADSTAAAILYPVEVMAPPVVAGADSGAIDTAAVKVLVSADPEVVPASTVVELPPALRGYVVETDSSGHWLPLVRRPGWRDVDAQQQDPDRTRQRRPPKRPTGSSTLEEHLFMVAELYRDRLLLPDSAAVVYQSIAARFPTSAQRSRALYSFAWIQFEQLHDAAAARPYLEQLVSEYGTTAHANAARRLLALPLERTAEEQAAEVFREVEYVKSAEPDRPERWIPQLDMLTRDFPGTVTAARAAYLAAWATENVVFDSAGAEARYDSVASRFPRTAYAELVEGRRRSQKDGFLAKMERELKTLGTALKTEERLFFIAAEPDSVDSTSVSRRYLGFAMRAHRREQFEQAKRLYQSSLDEKQGRNGDAHAGLGDVAWRQGYYEDAIDHLRRALKENPSSMLPQYRLFQYHLQQSQKDSANHYLRQITRNDRNNPDVLAVIDRFPTIASAEPELIEVDQLETISLEPDDNNLRLTTAFFGVVEPPLVRSSVVAQYPPDGSDSASVVIDVLVTREGRSDSVRVFRGDEPFSSEAIRAVTGYRYYPAENRKQEPLNVWVELVIPFPPPPPVGAARSAAASAESAIPKPATEMRTK
ncbi:MAG: tetratricopeptide repeat protein [bacterium]|nr:tetratricopeptide repeat protein [bacterium]